MFQEQRRFRRFEFYAIVTLGDATDVLPLHVRNISLGGAFLRATEQDLQRLDVGAVRSVEVADGHDKKNRAEVTGRIVRKRVDGVGIQWIGEEDAFKISGLTALHAIDFAMPRTVLTSFCEAQRCRAAGSWPGAGTMIRRTLEAVARDFHPQANNLYQGLVAMRTQGVLSQELWEWGDQLRLLGNNAAHPSDETITAQDCEDAIHFLIAILRMLYELRPKFQAMRARQPR